MPLSQSIGARRQRWKRWINRIGNEITQLRIDEWIFRRSMIHAKESGRIKPGNIVYRWMAQAFGDIGSIAVRALTDRNKRTYSLEVLLSDLLEHHVLLTRKWFVKRYPYQLSVLANADFDRIAGCGASVFKKGVIKADLRLLRSKTRQIKTLVDKRRAHRDRRRGTHQLPTFQVLHEAIDLLDNLCKKYKLVLLQTSADHLPIDIEDKDPDVRAVWR